MKLHSINLNNMSCSIQHLYNSDIMREMIKVLGESTNDQKMIPDDMGLIQDIINILGMKWDFKGKWKDAVFRFDGRYFTSKQITFVIEFLNDQNSLFRMQPVFGFKLQPLGHCFDIVIDHYATVGKQQLEFKLYRDSCRVMIPLALED